MIIEDKNLLLLIDLFGRLPYGPIKVQYEDKVINVIAVNSYWEIYPDRENYTLSIDSVKPYLRPMSSMTDQEREEFNKLVNLVEERCINAYGKGGYSLAFTELNDWLNKNMFDYRGLIPMGLALEAPEGMYKTECLRTRLQEEVRNYQDEERTRVKEETRDYVEWLAEMERDRRNGGGTD